MKNNDFQLYFEKTGIKPHSLSLALVAEIVKNHLRTFSFNNFAVLLEKDVSIDFVDIYEKIVIKGLGGYCFEHNRLLHDVLHYLGYNVRLVIGRVINNQDIDAPRTHRLTILEWEGENYLVDAGFGPKCLHSPIRIRESQELTEDNQTHRIILNSDNEYQLELLTEKGFYSLYTFNLNKFSESDCVLGNFYSHKHPEAVFLNNLVVSLIYPDKIFSIINNSFIQKGLNNTDYTEIYDYQTLKDIVHNYFGIILSKNDAKKIFDKISIHF